MSKKRTNTSRLKSLNTKNTTIYDNPGTDLGEGENVFIYWVQIFTACRKHFPVLSPFINYERICIMRNTMGTTSGAGTNLPEQMNPIRFQWSLRCSIFLVYSILFYRSLFVLLSFFLPLSLSVLLRLTESDYLFGIFLYLDYSVHIIM